MLKVVDRQKILRVLLGAAFCYRLAFFLFKYTGVFFFTYALGTKEGGKHALSIVLGCGYLLPLIWSARIGSQAQRLSSLRIGGAALAMSYVMLAVRPSFVVAWTFFAIGFGLVNPNFKAVFGATLAPDGRRIASDFNWLTFSINAAAFVAGFLAAPALRHDMLGLRILLAGCAILTAAFLFLLQTAIPARLDAALPTIVIKRSTNVATPGSRNEAYPTARLVAVLVVISFATLFWLAFELKSFDLAQWGRERLCPTELGIPIGITHLNSVNPLCYLMLVPVFDFFLRTTGKRMPQPQEVYFMGAGVVTMGVSLVLFSWAVRADGCVAAHWFGGLYLVQTVGELLLEPVGLDFINRNSPANRKTLFYVLWESNSGIAYLLSGLVVVSHLLVLGCIVLAGGCVLMAVAPWLGKCLRTAGG